MKERMIRFMSGRNGSDELCRFTNILCILLLLLSIVTPIKSLSLGFGLCILNMYRMCSKNIYKRSQENKAFLQVRGRVQSWFEVVKKRFEQRKTHVFFKCPSCKQTVRVPKGKGKISITCPKCGTAFVKKS